MQLWMPEAGGQVDFASVCCRSAVSDGSADINCTMVQSSARLRSRYVAFLYAAPTGMFHTSMKVLVSFNAGRSRTSGGVMLSSLQFMSPAVGCLVVGHAGAGTGSALLWTMNAGRTWYPVRF
jgi:hypothetical protein